MHRGGFRDGVMGRLHLPSKNLDAENSSFCYEDKTINISSHDDTPSLKRKLITTPDTTIDSFSECNESFFPNIKIFSQIFSTISVSAEQMKHLFHVEISQELFAVCYVREHIEWFSFNVYLQKLIDPKRAIQSSDPIRNHRFLLESDEMLSNLTGKLLSDS